MALAPLSAVFQSLPLLPTIKLGPSGADSQVCGFVCEAGSFSCCHAQTPQVFSIRGLRSPGLHGLPRSHGSS